MYHPKNPTAALPGTRSGNQAPEEAIFAVDLRAALLYDQWQMTSLRHLRHHHHRHTVPAEARGSL
jgi:hypothetical protein